MEMPFDAPGYDQLVPEKLTSDVVIYHNLIVRFQQVTHAAFTMVCIDNTKISYIYKITIEVPIHNFLSDIRPKKC